MVLYGEEGEVGKSSIRSSSQYILTENYYIRQTSLLSRPFLLVAQFKCYSCVHLETTGSLHKCLWYDRDPRF